MNNTHKPILLDRASALSFYFAFKAIIDKALIMIIIKSTIKQRRTVVAFCSYSSSVINDGSTLVDNAFINEFMPQAPAEFVKVYLYGLSLCTSPNQDYNTSDSAAAFLSVDEDDILSAYEYWQEMGIVQIICKRPLEVKYLPLKNRSGSSKIRTKGKYTEFNKQVQDIISGRMIKPIEYNEYYYLIESVHFEPEALIMIIKYCTVLKGENVGYAYISAVARSFASDNIKSTTAVEQKLLEQEKSTAEIKQVLDALGLKRAADIEERNQYLKWTNKFGFSHPVIIEVAKSLKKNGGVGKLDNLLTKYYEQRLFTMQEIAEYSALRDQMFEIAKNISRNLGLYYQNLENVVETYVAQWLQKGYMADTLELISHYCFRYSYRSLESMNDVVNKFYKLGLITVEAINQYTSGIVIADQAIKEVLDACKLLRSVTSSDRDFYKTWTSVWGFSQDAILLVAAKSVGTLGPISYMNKILSTLHSQNKFSPADVKAYLAKSATTSTDSSKIEKHEYTKQELDALFDSLDDIEV